MKKFTIFVEKLDSKEQTAEEIITDAWNNKPANESEYEFYHKMRLENYDGEVISGMINKLKSSNKI